MKILRDLLQSNDFAVPGSLTDLDAKGFMVQGLGLRGLGFRVYSGFGLTPPKPKPNEP